MDSCQLTSGLRAGRPSNHNTQSPDDGSEIGPKIRESYKYVSENVSQLTKARKWLQLKVGPRATLDLLVALPGSPL